jgi:chromosome partitioning protein
MSRIVTVAAYKGGVGKTTLALELAYLLNGPLVDLDWDKGGASKRWGYQPGERSPLLDALEKGRTPRLRKGKRKPDLLPADEDFEAVQPDADTMAALLEKWAADWGSDFVVVDTHPGGVPATHGAMAAATVVVSPVVLATGELDGLEGLLERAADYPLLIIPNKVPRVPDARLLRRLRELVTRFDVPVGPPISEHRRLPRRSARMVVSATLPPPKTWDQYVSELLAVAKAVKNYGCG